MPSLQPAFALASDVDVQVERRAGPRDEVEAACRWLVARHQDGTAWRDMTLVVPGKRKWRDPLVATLDALRIPHRLLVGHPGAVADFADDVVHAMSLYTAAEATGSVGAIVAMVGLGDLPWKQQSLDDAVDVTMAVLRRGRRVRVSWSRKSALTERLIDSDVTSPGSGGRTPG